MKNVGAAAMYIPNPGCFVFGFSSEVISVWTESDFTYGARVPAQYLDLAAVKRIPHHNCLVVTGSRNKLTIRTESRGVDDVFMTLQGVQLVTGCCVPNLRAIRTGSDNVLAVRTEGSIANSVLASTKVL